MWGDIRMRHQNTLGHLVLYVIVDKGEKGTDTSLGFQKRSRQFTNSQYRADHMVNKFLLDSPEAMGHGGI